MNEVARESTTSAGFPWSMPMKRTFIIPTTMGVSAEDVALRMSYMLPFFLTALLMSGIERRGTRERSKNPALMGGEADMP